MPSEHPIHITLPREHTPHRELEPMSDLKLTFVSALYDQTVALLTRQVRPVGIDLDYQPADDQRATFDKMGASQPFEISEMSGTEFVSRCVGGGSPLVGLPIFVSRVFRHSFLFVNRRAGIHTPKDLEGKRIGVPLYTMSAAVWLRGLLHNDYGVDFRGVQWVQGAMDSSGSHGTPTMPPLHKPVEIEVNTSGQPLGDLLAAGEIDAVMTPTLPAAFGKHPDVVRLWEDYRTVEADYFRRTSIFPIMHVVVLRRDAYEANPWIAKSLYDAFDASKARALHAMGETGAPRYMFPLLPGYLEETRDVFGADPWQYGVSANRKTLETLMGYLVQQGIIAHSIPIEELFVPELRNT